MGSELPEPLPPQPFPVRNKDEARKRETDDTDRQLRRQEPKPRHVRNARFRPPTLPVQPGFTLMARNLPPFKAPTRDEVWRGCGWQDGAHFCAWLCLPFTTKALLVYYVRVTFVLDLTASAALSAACVLSGNRMPAACVIGVLAWSHLLTAAFVVRAYHAALGSRWTAYRTVEAAVEVIALGPIIVPLLDAATMVLALGWATSSLQRVRAYTRNAARYGRAADFVAAFGTARTVIQAVSGAMPMLFVELGIIAAIATPNDAHISNTKIGELDDALIIAVAFATFATCLNLLAHAGRTARFARDANFDWWEYLPVLVEFRPTLPLHAIERQRASAVVVRGTPSRREVRALTKLLSLQPDALLHLDLFGCSLVDTDSALLAAVLRASANVKSVNLLGNAFSATAAAELVAACALAKPPGVRTVCGLDLATRVLELAHSNLGDVDAILLSHEVTFNKSILLLSLLGNRFVDAAIFERLVAAAERASTLVAAMDRAFSPAKLAGAAPLTGPRAGRTATKRSAAEPATETRTTTDRAFSGLARPKGANASLHSATAPATDAALTEGDVFPVHASSRTDDSDGMAGDGLPVRALLFYGAALRLDAAGTLTVSSLGQPVLAPAAAIDPVLSAMRAHAERSDVQAWALEAVARLCAADEQAADDAAKSGVIELLCAAMRAQSGSGPAHMAAGDVQVAGCAALAALCHGRSQRARARADEAIVAGMAGLVVGSLASLGRSRRDVAAAGCEALAALAECAVDDSPADALRGPARRNELAAAEAVPAILRALESHGRDAGVELAGLRALGALASDAGQAGRARAQLLLKRGAAGAAVRALEAAPTHAASWPSALALLANLAEGDDDAAHERVRAVAEAGGGRAAVSVLPDLGRAADVLAAAAAVRLLCALSADESVTAELVDGSAMDALASVLAADQADLQVCRDALRALAQCAGTQQPVAIASRAARFADAGAFKAVAAAMMGAHAADADVQAWGAAALGRCTAGTDASALSRHAQAAAEGALAAAVASMAGSGATSGSHEWGAITVANMVRSPLPSSRALADAAVDAGAAAALVKAMRHNQADLAIVQVCVEGLAHLARSGDDADDAGATMRLTALADAEVAESIVDAMVGWPDACGLQRSACAALRHFTAGGDAGATARRQLTIDAGASQALCDAARAHSKDSELQAHFCAAAGQLAGGADDQALEHKDELEEAGAIRALVAAARMHAITCELLATLGLAALADGPPDDEGAGTGRAAEAVGAIAIAIADRPFGDEAASEWVCALLARFTEHALAPASAAQRPPMRGAVRMLLALGSGTQFVHDEAVTHACASAVDAVCGGVAGTGERAAELAQCACDAGAFAFIAAASVAHPRSARVARSACAAAAALTAADSPDAIARRVLAIEAGVPCAAASALLSHEPTAGRAAAAALGYLCMGTDYARLQGSVVLARAHACSAGLYEYIRTRAERGGVLPDEAQLRWALVVTKAAERLALDGVVDASANGGGPAGSDATEGALRLLIAVAASYQAALPAASTGAIDALARLAERDEQAGGDAAFSLALANAGALDATIGTMRRAVGEAGTQLASARVLSSLCAADATGTAATRAVESGAKSALCGAIAMHWPQPDVCSECVRALRALSGPLKGTAQTSSAPQDDAAPASVARALIDALASAPTNLDVAESSLLALSKVASQVPAHAAAAGAIAAATAALTAHAAAPTVQLRGLELCIEAVRRASDRHEAGLQATNEAFRAGAAACAARAIDAHSTDGAIVGAALELLLALAAGDDEGAEGRRKGVAEAGAINAIALGLAVHARDARVLGLGARLCAALVDDLPAPAADARAIKLIESGAVASLLDAIKEQQVDERLVEGTMIVLARLTAPALGADVRCAELMAQGCERALLIALRDYSFADIGCAVNAALALRNLAAAGDWAGLQRRQALIDGPLPRALIYAMSTHSAQPALQSAGASAIIKLATYTPAEQAAGEPCARKDVLVSAGALGCIVDALHSSGDAPSVAELGARALASITAGQDAGGLARKAFAFEAKAIPALASAMRQHAGAPAVQEAGCGALRNVCYGKGHKLDVMRKNEAVECGALAIVVGAMRTHPRDRALQLMGCGAITSIAFGFDPANLSAPSFAQVALDAGALDAVFAAMDGFATDLAVQEQGVKALRNLAHGGANDLKAVAVQRTMAEQGTIGAIVYAMHVFANKAQLVEECLKALQNICTSSGPAVKKRANEAAARAAVGKAKKDFLSNAAIAEAADALFRVL